MTERLEREAEAAIPVLEELGDDEGLARAWNSLCEVGLMWCHAADVENASERAAYHAERAGDRAALGYAASWRMIAPTLGMATPEAGMRRCEEVRAGCPTIASSRRLAEIRQGRLRIIARSVRRGQEEHAALGGELPRPGPHALAGWNSTNAAWLEILAGDLEAAERALRRGMATSSRSVRPDSDQRRP